MHENNIRTYIAECRYRIFNNAVKKTMATPNGDTEINDTKVKIEPEEVDKEAMFVYIT